MAQSPENQVHGAEQSTAPRRSVTVEDLVVVFGSLAVFVIGVILAIAFAIR
jgi:hypothetical protein